MRAGSGTHSLFQAKLFLTDNKHTIVFSFPGYLIRFPLTEFNRFIYYWLDWAIQRVDRLSSFVKQLEGNLFWAFSFFFMLSKTTTLQNYKKKNTSANITTDFIYGLFFKLIDRKIAQVEIYSMH